MDNTNVNVESTPESVQPSIREKIKQVFSSKIFLVLIIAVAVSLITGIIDAIQHKPDFTSGIEWLGSTFSVDVSPLVKVLDAAEVVLLIGSFIKLIPTLLAVAGLVLIMLSVKSEGNLATAQFTRGATFVKWYFIIQSIKITLLEVSVVVMAIVSIIAAAQAGDISFVLIIIAVAVAAVAIGALAIVGMYYTNNIVHFRTVVPSYTSNKNIVQISVFVVVINYIRVALAIFGAIRSGGWVNAIILSVTLVMINLMLMSYKKIVGEVDVEARKEYIEKLRQNRLARKANK